MVSIIALLLLIPIIAMQFTNEVKWTLFDFIMAAILLLGTGLTAELIFRKVKKAKLRIAFYIVLLALLFFIWAELAVGILGALLSGH